MTTQTKTQNGQCDSSQKPQTSESTQNGFQDDTRKHNSGNPVDRTNSEKNSPPTSPASQNERDRRHQEETSHI